MTSVQELLESLHQAAEQVDGQQLTALARLVAGAPRVFVAGAGRSGLVARTFANRLVHLGTTVHVVGEVTCPSIQPDDLLLAVSRSGNTPGILSAGQRASTLHARVACLTTQPTSPLALLCEMTLLVPEPQLPQPLGQGFEQLAFCCLDTVVLELMNLLGVEEDDMAVRHANIE